MAKIFSTRWEFIRPFVEGKTVLDIGPAELTGTVNQEKLDRALWPRILKSAKTVVALEKNPEQIHSLREKGYDVHQGDAESFDLGSTFDAIVAGELIEHLSNPGLFLDCVRRHLKPGGTLVMTTPNRFDALFFFSLFRRNIIPKYDKPLAKHVAYYDANCLTDLLIRHNFSDITIAYYEWVGQQDSHIKSKLLVNWIKKNRPDFLPGLLISAHCQNTQ